MGGEKMERKGKRGGEGTEGESRRLGLAKPRAGSASFHAPVSSLPFIPLPQAAV